MDFLDELEYMAEQYPNHELLTDCQSRKNITFWEQDEIVSSFTVEKNQSQRRFPCWIWRFMRNQLKGCQNTKKRGNTLKISWKEKSFEKL